ncbi:Positive regulator of CheA protein activity (CheW) [hydrothermal vent metagenome]|uniref:Chemotaxis protein CheW n=1 Tax=hydrothermal vent metagenome TaxID=652676 RepID=A0A3B1BJQ7_9ZZZZ
METAQTVNSADNSVIISDMADTDQFLTFMLAGEEYGVDILRVQEIKGWDAVTSIPNTPTYIRGVINLRGTIVPIIDMRIRFGLEELEYGPLTVVIVLKVETESNSRTMGIVVDGVSDVYNVPDEQIKPSPDFGDAVDTEFVKGLATVEEKMVIILDIDSMLNASELTEVDSVAKTD